MTTTNTATGFTPSSTTGALIRNAQNAHQLARSLRSSAMDALVADITRVRGTGGENLSLTTPQFWAFVNHHASEETFSFAHPDLTNESRVVKDLLVEWLKLYIA